MFRYLESGRHFRFGHASGSSYAVDYLSGVSPLPMPVTVQQFATVTPTPGDVLEVRQTAAGTVECFVNGVLTHRFHDTASGFRSTLHGLAANGRTARFDDFVVTTLPRY